MVILTTAEYAQLRGITEGAVRKAIKEGAYMEGKVKLSKFGKSHQIHVTEAFIRAAKKRLKIVA
jgi:hypothetical protein